MDKLNKYAQLLVKYGANVQKGEDVFISSGIENPEFTRLVVEECYKAGARKVSVMWGDEQTGRLKYVYETKEALCDVYNYIIARGEEIVDKKGVLIHIISDDPNILKGISPELIASASKAFSLKNKKYHDSAMKGEIRWTLGAYPNPAWAKAVFPKLNAKKGVKKLWDLIEKAVRLNTPDPVAEWENLSNILAQRVKILNEAQIKSFRYTNSLGTDLTIEPVQNYLFHGGTSISPSGIAYSPNIPTEEVFTAPKKDSANGKIVASMPLIYNGNKIDGFWLTLKDGKIIDYDAKEGKEFLKELIETDEGSCYLGEIALVGYDSPIQNLKTLFYNTLYDENASCHFAFGCTYPSCVQNGEKMSPQELLDAKMNYSLEHEDFMVGTPDLTITATKQDGTQMPIFKNGNWAF